VEAGLLRGGEPLALVTGCALHEVGENLARTASESIEDRLREVPTRGERHEIAAGDSRSAVASVFRVGRPGCGLIPASACRKPVRSSNRAMPDMNIVAPVPDGACMCLL
jgi:hypothetical protein